MPKREYEERDFATYSLVQRAKVILGLPLLGCSYVHLPVYKRLT